MSEAAPIDSPGAPAPAEGAARHAPRRRFAPGGGVALRTLILIRWVAVAGQLAALGVVHFGLGWPLPLQLALMTVVGSVLLNVMLIVRRPARGRLGDTEAALYLGFDTTQLAVLLFLTGGLQNPFALLILGPVAVSATVLSRRATTALCMLVVAAATALGVWHLPLPWSEPGFALPTMYVLGTWVAVVIGTLSLAAYASSVAGQGRQMQQALTETQLALAREQRLSSLGALAAAAAHELGSPLSTIAVTVKELVRETPADEPIAGELRLLAGEADRCRDILAELGRAPEDAEGGGPYSEVPLGTLVEAAAAPHASDIVTVEFTRACDDDSTEPTIRRAPELLHGLGNIVQNAVQFAATAVWVDIAWSRAEVRVRVRDDGPGFAPAVLGAIGQPYISSRRGEHLGLGIFIAQTLLEATGAALSFRNARAVGGRPAGAEVAVAWQRRDLEVPSVPRGEQGRPRAGDSE